MEEYRHSITAVWAAAWRAYHHELDPEPRIFDDPCAHLFLSASDREAFENWCADFLRQLDPTLAALCPDRLALVYHALRAVPGSASVLARARYVEEVLSVSMDRGVRQYVIIGAGFDTFALRRPSLRERLQVFEIDLPATQDYKRDQMAKAGLSSPEHLHFTAANLEVESLASALSRVPYRPQALTFFAWPGVTMFLTPTAIFGTLRSIVSVAAPGSELVFDYITPERLKPEASQPAKLGLGAMWSLREPMITGLDPSLLGSELSNAGLRLVENLGPHEIQARYFSGRRDGFRAPEHNYFARAVLDAHQGP